MHYGGNYNHMWTPIRKISRKLYTGNILKIQTKRGILEVTPDHLLITNNGKNLRADKIEVGMGLAFSRLLKKSSKSQFFIGNPDIAWFFGFFCAEGSASWNKNNGSGQVSIANKDYTLIKKTSRILEKEFNVRYNISESEGLYKVNSNNKGFYNFIIKNFYTKNKFGLRGFDKRVPKSILNAPLEIRKAFLEGYIDGDGHRYNCGSWHCATTSPTLAAGLQWLIEKTTDFNTTIRTYQNKKAFFISATKVNPSEKNIVKNINFYKYKSDYVYDIETDAGAFTTAPGLFRVHNCAVVLTAQIYGIPDIGTQLETRMKFGAPKRPYGGEYFLHAVGVLVHLTQIKSDLWKATVVDASDLPKAEATFKILTEGIR
jgi:intein/homing endonuclease